MSLAAELRGLREDLARYAAERNEQRPELGLLTKEHAAQRLDTTVRTLDRQIHAGRIQVVLWGGKKMVPLSELERIVTPLLPIPRKKRAAKRGRTAKQHAENVRAALRKAR